MAKKTSQNNKNKRIKPKSAQEPATSIPTFPIVGIGASAGGLEAFSSFFKNLPANSGMAFVIIQHLDPTQSGMLPELLQRTTSMSVMVAKDSSPLKPNCVYVISPNKSISILNGKLHLFEPTQKRGLRLPIDIFFQSLALDQRDNSVGIILSGMGSDGSSGLKAIKEAGGYTLVQEPASAKFDAMPSNAIHLTKPDIIATAEELPKKLLSLFSKAPFKISETEPDLNAKNDLDKIILILREQAFQDFSQYKKNTLLRRVERRKAVHLFTGTKDYIRFLQENKQEREILSKELLIGVTNFFRDPSVWSYLQENVIPKLIEELPNGHTIRIWVAACSTGEEAYSLAIIFKEALDKVGIEKRLSLQIFATDLDIDAIEYARKGIYRDTISADVSDERLNRFFSKEQHGYKVQSSIRELVVFANHNLLKDPPFIKLDLLSCRNLLIYLESVQQQKIVSLFNYCLKAGGIMVLGTAETRGASANGFTEINSKLKIFKRTSSNLNASLIHFPSTNFPEAQMKRKITHTPPAIESIQELTDQLLLNHFSPASVLVNVNGDILYITGSTGKYLEAAKGKANWNIHAMAREGLREVLPSGIRKAMKTAKAVTLTDITIANGKQKNNLSITIEQIRKPEPIKGMILIVFNNVEPTGKDALLNAKKRTKAQPKYDLERELRQAQEALKIAREEMQAFNEESKSINEELQSTNEELQSTNEELTTSKEEMQSLNEELQTVNNELQIKVSDLELATNDMKNLLRTTELATLFLDKGLNIRRFTDSVTNIFKLRETDIGRPFTDIANKLDYAELENHSREVIKTLLPFETTILTKNATWLKVRIVAYRTHDDRIDGLVLTFTDITELEKMRLELKSLREDTNSPKP